jgi:hypothetical protein
VHALPAGKRFTKRTWSRRDLAGEREFAELDTGHTELSDVGARTTAHGATVADAHGGRVAGKLLQLLLSGEELLVGGRRIGEQSLEFGALTANFAVSFLRLSLR